MRRGEDIGIIWVDLLILRGDSLLAKLGVRWPTVEHWPTEHMLHLWDCFEDLQGITKVCWGRGGSCWWIFTMRHTVYGKVLSTFPLVATFLDVRFGRVKLLSPRPWWQWSCSSLQWPSQKPRTVHLLHSQGPTFLALKKVLQRLGKSYFRIGSHSEVPWVGWLSCMYLVCICGLNRKVKQTPNSALTGADSAKLIRYWSSILDWTKKRLSKVASQILTR